MSLNNDTIIHIIDAQLVYENITTQEPISEPISEPETSSIIEKNTNNEIAINIDSIQHTESIQVIERNTVINENRQTNISSIIDYITDRIL
jgi:hypothetical protein